jgi:hypothetical protein
MFSTPSTNSIIFSLSLSISFFLFLTLLHACSSSSTLTIVFYIYTLLYISKLSCLICHATRLPMTILPPSKTSLACHVSTKGNSNRQFSSSFSLSSFLVFFCYVSPHTSHSHIVGVSYIINDEKKRRNCYAKNENCFSLSRIKLIKMTKTKTFSFFSFFVILSYILTSFGRFKQLCIN